MMLHSDRCMRLPTCSGVMRLWVRRLQAQRATTSVKRLPYGACKDLGTHHLLHCKLHHFWIHHGCRL
jgi:hypothetical protein